MKQSILTFEGLDKVYFTIRELPESAERRLMIDYTTISPGTELFSIIRQGGIQHPGYIMTGHDGTGRHYFVFPSLAESHSAHCNVRDCDQNTILLELPDCFPLKYAGFLRFINIGMHAFNHCTPLPEEVAVIGLGPVGNLAAQTAHCFGCRTVGVDASEARRELARECGIAAVMAPADFARIRNRFDLIIDTVAASDTLATAAAALRENGTCSMIGIIKPGDLAAADLCQSIWQRNLRFISGWEMKNPPEWTLRNLRRGLNYILAGAYRLDRLLTGVVPAELPAIERVYAALARDPDHNFTWAIDWRGR